MFRSSSIQPLRRSADIRSAGEAEVTTVRQNAAVPCCVLRWPLPRAMPLSQLLSAIRFPNPWQRHVLGRDPSDFASAPAFIAGDGDRGMFGAVWRVGKRMASKVHLMKFLQEVRGYSLVTCRRPVSQLSGVYLMQLRSHLSETTTPSRRRLPVKVHPQDLSETPSPVTIHRVV